MEIAFLFWQSNENYRTIKRIEIITIILFEAWVHNYCNCTELCWQYIIQNVLLTYEHIEDKNKDINIHKGKSIFITVYNVHNIM